MCSTPIRGILNRTMKSLYIDAALGKPIPRPPVWMMRQAGRYLPEYREIRQTQSFMQMMKTPEIAAKVTLQPIRRFGMDAAILFSDILVTAEAMGGQLDYIEKKGPVFSNPVQGLADATNLETEGIDEKLAYVFSTVRLIKKELTALNIPLIGFAGGPFTVAAYLVEGQSSAHLKVLRKMIYESTDIFDCVIEKLVAVTIDYLNGQIAAGVDALMLFDTWAGYLNWEDYKRYCVAPLKQIIQGLNNPNNLPITVFSKNSGMFADLLTQTGADVIGIDSQSDIGLIRSLVPDSFALQGNLDPFLLYAPESVLESRVKAILAAMRPYKGYIFNLGHGINPDIDPEKVKLVVDLVKSSGN